MVTAVERLPWLVSHEIFRAMRARNSRYHVWDLGDSFDSRDHTHAKLESVCSSSPDT